MGQQDLPESFGRRLLPGNGQEMIATRSDTVWRYRQDAGLVRKTTDLTVPDWDEI
jgi:catechol-2,3-dioxygenase